MTAVREATVVRVDFDRLRQFVTHALGDLGFAAEDAAIAAEVLVRTEARGIRTHGIYHLPNLYLRQITAGGINVQATTSIVRETPGTALLEGDGAMGQIAAVKATEIAARKAREVGCATVVVRNTNHCGAIGYYVSSLAERGLIGIAAQNTPAAVAPPGAAGKVIGNQPTAYGIPDPDRGAPIVLDIAMSAAAATKIRQMRERGQPIPEGWIVDGHGMPTTDPTPPITLAPMAGHKGYGLCVLIESMTSVLSGGAILSEMVLADEATPMGVGFWVTAIDVEAFMPLDQFAARVRQMREEIHAAPTVPGVDRLLVPGEPEADFEAETRANGIPMDAVNWDPLRRLADELGRADELEQTRVA
jgi:LDH2 family malate/lactate/ureidoglycolate dehydrogenase